MSEEDIQVELLTTEEDKDNIKQQLEELTNKVASLEDKINEIKMMLETDCKKMVEHIEFVETVYEKVKYPFNYVMNNVSNVIRYTPRPRSTIDL